MDERRGAAQDQAPFPSRTDTTTDDQMKLTDGADPIGMIFELILQGCATELVFGVIERESRGEN